MSIAYHAGRGESKVKKGEAEVKFGEMEVKFGEMRVKFSEMPTAAPPFLGTWHEAAILAALTHPSHRRWIPTAEN